VRGLFEPTSRQSMITTGIPAWMSVAANELLSRVCTNLLGDRILQYTAWLGTEPWVLQHTKQIQCSLSISWYAGWCVWSESRNLINKLSGWLQLNPVNPLHAARCDAVVLMSLWVSEERTLVQQVRRCCHIYKFNCIRIYSFISLSLMHGVLKVFRQNGVSLARWTAALFAGLLVRSQYPEGPATGHIGTGFAWFPCV
jgi:hypothetical protein